MTHHQQEVQTWLISTKFYNSLPPGMQRIVMDGVQVGCDTAQNHAISTEYEWRKAMENTGTVFVEINTTEYNTFKDKIGPQREMIQNAVSPEVWEAYVGAEEQAQEE